MWRPASFFDRLPDAPPRSRYVFHQGIRMRQPGTGGGQESTLAKEVVEYQRARRWRSLRLPGARASNDRFAVQVRQLTEHVQDGRTVRQGMVQLQEETDLPAAVSPEKPQLPEGSRTVHQV